MRDFSNWSQWCKLLYQGFSPKLATQLAEAMCPSGPTKLICSNVLHIKTLGNQSLQTSQSIQMSPWSGLEPSTDARSLGLRSGVLCTVFVHACFALLDLRFADHVKTTEARGHEVHFQSSARTFRHLLLIVEVSLHFCAST